MFGRKDNLSTAQRNALACCAVLIVQDFGAKAVMRMDIAGQKTPPPADAVLQIEKLAAANDQVPFIREVFDHIIMPNQYEVVRGIFQPIKPDALPDLDLPANFPNLWKVVTNNANEGMDAYLAYLADPGDSRPGATFHNITTSAVLHRINKCIRGYELAVRSLTVFGYRFEELAEIENIAAWDLARCGHVARIAANAGAISTDDAWRHMEAAGKAAYMQYNSWRQFLAAYFLGRGMSLCTDDLGDFGDTVRYLLKDKKSPYQLYPLKSSEE